MKFLEQQQAARRATGWLRAHFALIALVGIPIFVLTTSVALTYVTFFLDGALGRKGSGPEWGLHPLLPALWLIDWPGLARKPVLTWLIVDILFAAYIALFFYVDMRRKARNSVDSRAMALEARRLDRRDRDPEHRQLLNIVDEMSLAAGIPAPAVYVWGETIGVNAVSEGNNIAESAIFVSRGALALLNREETEAMVAHEMSHILNGDIPLYRRLFTLNLMFFAAPVLGIAMAKIPRHNGWSHPWWFWTIMRWIIYLMFLPCGVVLTILGTVQVLLVWLLEKGIVRQRERLADAYALQFTRNPGAIKNLLMKIAVYGGMPGTVKAGALVNTLASNHMFFASVTKRRWFDTHPSIEERLRAADPRYHPNELVEFRERMLSRDKLLSIAAQNEAAARRAREVQQARVETVGREIGRVATVWAESGEAATPLTTDPAVTAARARALALLLDREARIRAEQVAVVDRRLGREVGVEVVAEYVDVSDASAETRITKMNALLPQLRELQPAAQRSLLETLRAVQQLDENIEVFEYALGRAIMIFLRDLLERRLPHGNQTLSKTAGSLHVLMSVLAQLGSADMEDAAAAYAAGMASLSSPNFLRYQPLQPWAVPLDRALFKLDDLHAGAKQELIRALATVIKHDSEMTGDEYALLRVITASLHMPMPRMESVPEAAATAAAAQR